jgi:hypothetical protein
MLCQKLDNTQVHSQPNLVDHDGSNVVPLGVSQSDLKTLETNKEWVSSTQKFQMEKSKEQELVWANLVAKVVDSIVVFERKKSRIGQLEFEVTMFQEMLKKMQEGGGSMLHPQMMIHDFDFNIDLSVVKCPSKSSIIVNECHVCAQWFPGNDIFVANCHTYHVFCIAYYVGSHQCCKVASCKETFHPAWLQSISVRPLNEDALIYLRATNAPIMAIKIEGRDFYFM